MFVEGLHLLASFITGLQNELNNGNSVDAYSEHPFRISGRIPFSAFPSAYLKKILYSDFKKAGWLSCNIYFVMWQLSL
jgi:hypothetical protein